MEKARGVDRALLDPGFRYRSDVEWADALGCSIRTQVSRISWPTESFSPPTAVGHLENSAPHATPSG